MAAMRSPAAEGFEYDRAFSRNLGWVTADEQRRLRDKRVAIAGLGGVGGIHLLTLARLGIGKARIADFDRFDIANFNRQAGATLSTLGQPKVEVLEAMARDINPGIEIERFADGVTAANVDAFLAGVDIYVDGLDFFAFEARERVFAACHAAGVPAVTVAPLGMGAALVNFMPGRMSFEQYFRLAGASDSEKRLRFLVGLAPSMQQRHYLADPRFVDFANDRGPSTAMACQLCAGVAGTEALKILLGRGPVTAAPVSVHYDAYRGQLKRSWRPWGNRNPLQRFVIALARRQIAGIRPPPASDGIPD
jgi:molybdopterin/thiamine biosynthesis adenylyltransferase